MQAAAASLRYDQPQIRPRLDYWIRPRLFSDLPEIEELARRAYPPPHGVAAHWNRQALREHILQFPEGQLVAVSRDGSVIGDATTLRVELSAALRPHTWDGITGSGLLGTHTDTGMALYGVDIMVAPEWRGKGLGRSLYEARFALGRRLGCLCFVAGARIPGYHQEAPDRSVADYVASVVAGDRIDPTLSGQLRMGFSVMGILPDYFPDPESCNFAVHITKPLQRY